jgi:hypothetical protein
MRAEPPVAKSACGVNVPGDVIVPAGGFLQITCPEGVVALDSKGGMAKTNRINAESRILAL